MSSLMFKFLSHFEFNFVSGMRVCSSSSMRVWFTWNCSALSIPLGEGSIFP